MPDRSNRTVWILAGVVVVLVMTVGVLAAVLVATRESEGPPPTTAESVEPTSTSAPTTAAGGGPPRNVDLADVVMQEGLIQRQYLVMSPKDMTDGERLPAVMVLHGLGFDRFSISNAAEWAQAVERDEFIAVFPQGLFNSWNAGPCCPPASLTGVDDVSWLTRVVAELTARPDVDPARLYLTGFSNGGIMTYAMACAQPGLFAAVAPMSGTNLGGCAPAQPVSLLHMHGDPDPVVPYDGAVTLSQLLASADFPPVPDSVAAWAAADGCDPTPRVTESDGPVTRELWGGCDAGKQVELITYPGKGHAWPSSPLNGLDELLWFFDLQG